MRLFTAVLFDEDIKTSIYDVVTRLKGMAKGSFTTRDNLHLTVNFIGETNRLDEVKHAMENAVDRVKPGEFELSVRGFGKFKRNEGDIYWVGVERENELWRLQKELVHEFKEAGFYDIDDREYKPHLTLGRRVIVNSGFQPEVFGGKITPMQMKVNKISLMKSERIQGKLVYTEIFYVKLKDASSKNTVI